jgi:hypothetical protein
MGTNEISKIELGIALRLEEENGSLNPIYIAALLLVVLGIVIQGAAWTWKNRKDLVRGKLLHWARRWVLQHTPEFYAEQWAVFAAKKCLRLRTNLRDAAVAPRQREWHDVGENLKLLKRTLSPAIYQANTAALRPFFHRLGELLKRHAWAIDKRSRRYIQLPNSRDVSVVDVFKKISWVYGNGQPVFQ